MGTEEIVLYHYSFSPYARRILWYLALRGIPYSQCLQPPMMPRPDVGRLGIAYRRIPIMSIGRDVYLDTRLQLRKLEELPVSAPKLGASKRNEQAVERLLASLAVDSGVFSTAMALLPTDLPLLRDPAFQKDRSDFTGVKFSAEGLQRARPELLREFAGVFELLETTLLADGRDWVLKTEGPGLADIEAVWPLHWMAGMPGALPEKQFSPAVYPKAYAWIKRFSDAVSAAKKKMAKPRTLSGEEAAKLITGSAFHDSEGNVDAADFVAEAQCLKKGDPVTVSPTDTGASRTDAGKLVSMDKDEVVFETTAEGGSVRVHAPRHGFRVQKGRGAVKL
ncbi:Uncharacterized protein TPAR_01151 [Tolypocladium paradoxum]|uniref:GST N-terminal domain-containing protein n=1 Tax=Tolypocladium paradoxum TaxID=94208 RepID=A0A2S4L863_9HYPO|nr:Uncharacterized protein TPAR_01151 [Tolypocladium paradoxum]